MADDILNVNDGTPTVRAGALGGASMRYHELAVQSWLNGLFFVREGYPVPVVFTSPMDAFSAFKQLWADENNPFAYLFDLKDSSGTPLYEPYPSPVRYPVISVHRKGWKYRSYQNFSIHRWRHINWPTIANAGPAVNGPQADGWDITKCQLGNVTTSRMPMAWDYRFQIDHFCNRPDTQAFFVEQLMQEFWRSGGTPQTWIAVPYPGWGMRRVRLYIEGDIESLTPEEPEEGKNVEFRTSFSVVVEGFDVDLRYEVYPALWNVIFRFGPVAPMELEEVFYGTKTVDVRINGSNTTLDSHLNVPASGTCQDDLWNVGTAEQMVVQMVSEDYTASTMFGDFTVGTTPAVRYLEAYGTDYASQTHEFVYGGIELYVNTQNGVQTTSFVSGNLADTIITLAGTDHAALTTSFVAGTLQDSILYFYGTNYGTNSTSFAAGTLADTVFSAGVFDYGTLSTSLLSGTLATVIIVTGTWFEQAGQSTGFVSGALV